MLSISLQNISKTYTTIMNQWKRIGILFVLGVAVILFRQYESRQNLQTAQESTESAQLIRVVDGDTIIAQVNGVEGRIRIIGIDTPESVIPGRDPECFGAEASIHISELLSQPGDLLVQTDPTQDMRDRNGRLLAHVFLDQVNIAQQMVFDGFAYEYTYRDPYIYQYEYQQAQDDAMENQRGLWSPDTCNGKR